MSTQIIGMLFIAFCACISLIEGSMCARKAIKEHDTVLTIFGCVFYICGIVLVLCLNSIRV